MSSNRILFASACALLGIAVTGPSAHGANAARAQTTTATATARPHPQAAKAKEQTPPPAQTDEAKAAAQKRAYEQAQKDKAKEQTPPPAQTDEAKAAAQKRAYEQAQKDKEAQRIAKERADKERAEKERAEKEGKPAPATAPPATAKPGEATAAEQREIAKKAARFAQIHRTRQARMDRLIRIYKQKGDTAKVAKLEDMRAKENVRTDHAMEGFRKKLSAENWGKLNSEIQKHHGRDEHQKAKAETPPKRG